MNQAITNIVLSLSASAQIITGKVVVIADGDTQRKANKL